MDGNNSIDDELTKNAKNESAVKRINNSSKSSTALHQVGIAFLYLIALLAAISLILSLVFCIDKLNSAPVNSMGFSIIGAVFGAIVGHFLTKNKEFK